MADSQKVRDALHLALSELPNDAKPKLFRRYNDALRELDGLEEQLRSREDALREVYELIYLGEADNALHGLDAYMIREDIFRGEAASSPASEPHS